jgi:hypothetical protein
VQLERWLANTTRCFCIETMPTHWFCCRGARGLHCLQRCGNETAHRSTRAKVRG